MSIKKANKSNKYNIDDETRYQNSLGISYKEEKYIIKEGIKDVTQINTQFKEPIIELYHKICKVLCIKCNNLANSNHKNCNFCNYKIQEYCSSCRFLNPVLQSFCNNCEKSINSYQGGFLLHHKNKNNYIKLKHL